MKRILYFTIILTGLLLSSCTKKAAEFVNNIPDSAVMVASLNPGQIYAKGEIASLETIKNQVHQEFVRSLIEDPAKSGLLIDEYAYVFIYLLQENPVGGMVAGIKDKARFEETLRNVDKTQEIRFESGSAYTYFMPENDDVMLAWDEEKVFFMAFGKVWDSEIRLGEIDRLFNLPREEAITSMVDFKGFLKNMKDINIWFSSSELKPLLEKMDSDIQVNLPMSLYNNYAHFYCEFADGAFYVNSETHFSDDVQKNIDQFLVMKESIDPKLLEMAPGGNLLLALGGGMELDKIRDLVNQFGTPDLDSVGNAIEDATGMKPQELWDAFTGDFIISVNGTEENPILPVEIFIGLGVDDAAVQEKLLGTVKDKAPVEEDGDFFMINIQGNEIYSGIVNGVWVITNSKGYSRTIKEGKLDKCLKDTRFKELASSPVAMYMNLNPETYPSALKNIMSQSPQGKMLYDYLSESFTCMLMTGENNKSNVTLETAKPNENSLYTLLKISELEQ